MGERDIKGIHYSVPVFHASEVHFSTCSLIIFDCRIHHPVLVILGLQFPSYYLPLILFTLALNLTSHFCLLFIWAIIEPNSSFHWLIMCCLPHVSCLRLIYFYLFFSLWSAIFFSSTSWVLLLSCPVSQLIYFFSHAPLCATSRTSHCRSWFISSLIEPESTFHQLIVCYFSHVSLPWLIHFFSH